MQPGAGAVAQACAGLPAVARRPAPFRVQSVEILRKFRRLDWAAALQQWRPLFDA
jgi:hypothetical protein